MEFELRHPALAGAVPNADYESGIRRGSLDRIVNLAMGNES